MFRPSKQPIQRRIKIVIQDNIRRVISMNGTIIEMVPVRFEIIDPNNHVVQSIYLHELNNKTRHIFSSCSEKDKVEFFFEKNKNTITIPSRMNENLIGFLKQYKPKEVPIYCCHDFAYEMKFVRENMRDDLHTSGSWFDKSKETSPGDLISLFQEDSIQHSAIYIGEHVYLSLFGARGPLLATTLDEIKRVYAAPNHAVLAAYVNYTPLLSMKSILRKNHSLFSSFKLPQTLSLSPSAVKLLHEKNSKSQQINLIQDRFWDHFGLINYGLSSELDQNESDPKINHAFEKLMLISALLLIISVSYPKAYTNEGKLESEFSPAPENADELLADWKEFSSTAEPAKISNQINSSISGELSRYNGDSRPMVASANQNVIPLPVHEKTPQNFGQKVSGSEQRIHGVCAHKGHVYTLTVSHFTTHDNYLMLQLHELLIDGAQPTEESLTPEIKHYLDNYYQMLASKECVDKLFEMKEGALRELGLYDSLLEDNPFLQLQTTYESKLPALPHDSQRDAAKNEQLSHLFSKVLLNRAKPSQMLGKIIHSGIMHESVLGRELSAHEKDLIVESRYNQVKTIQMYSEAIVVGEGYTENLLKEDLPTAFIQKSQSLFPQGMPPFRHLLNPGQCAFLLQHPAEEIALALEYTRCIYKSIEREIADDIRQMVESDITHNRRYINPADAIDEALQAHNPLIDDIREMEAIKCINEAVILHTIHRILDPSPFASHAVTVLLNFGREHRVSLSELCKANDIPYQFISTVSPSSQDEFVRYNGDSRNATALFSAKEQLVIRVYRFIQDNHAILSAQPSPAQAPLDYEQAYDRLREALLKLFSQEEMKYIQDEHLIRWDFIEKSFVPGDALLMKIEQDHGLWQKAADAFHAIPEGTFDPENADHRQRATYFAQLRQGPACFEMSFKGSDPHHPHIQHATFEVLTGPNGQHLQYTILQDFGKTIPSSFQSIERRFMHQAQSVFAKLNCIQTESNHLVIHIEDAYVEAVTTEEKNLSRQMLDALLNDCQKIGADMGADKVSVQFPEEKYIPGKKYGRGINLQTIFSKKYTVQGILPLIPQQGLKQTHKAGFLTLALSSQPHEPIKAIEHSVELDRYNGDTRSHAFRAKPEEKSLVSSAVPQISEKSMFSPLQQALKQWTFPGKARQAKQLQKKIELRNQAIKLNFRLQDKTLSAAQSALLNQEYASVMDALKQVMHGNVEQRSQIKVTDKIQPYLQFTSGFCIQLGYTTLEMYVISYSGHAAASFARHWAEKMGATEPVTELTSAAAGLGGAMVAGRTLFAATGIGLVCIAGMEGLNRTADYIDRHEAETAEGRLAQSLVQSTRDVLHLSFSPITGMVNGLSQVPERLIITGHQPMDWVLNALGVAWLHQMGASINQEVLHSVKKLAEHTYKLGQAVIDLDMPLHDPDSGMPMIIEKEIKEMKETAAETLEQYEDVAAQFHLATSQLYTPVPALNRPNASYEITKIPRKTSVAQISTRKSTPLQPKSDLSASKKDMKSSRQSTYKRKQSMVDVKHANELTDFLNQQSVQYIEKAEAARLASADLSQIYQHNKKPKSVLSKEHRLVVQKASYTMQEFGSASAELSRFALHLGGHQRTWEGVGKFGTELSSLGTSLEKFSNASSLFSLQSFSGTLGTINAVMGIADALFGKKKESELSVMRKEMNQGFTMIMAALQAVYQDMMKEFQNTQNLIVHGVFTRLTAIDAKLDRHEKIMTDSFKEAELSPLIDTIHYIKEDFQHKHLNDDKREKLLSYLGSWLENHCKSSIQTSVSRDSDDMETCVRIMEDHDFDCDAMFPYLMRQLGKAIPNQLLPINLSTQLLSNLTLQRMIVDVYCTAVVRYKMTGNWHLSRIESTLNHIQETEKIIVNIRDNKVIWQMLFKQHQYYRRQVGLAIAKCRAEISSGSSATEPFGSLLESIPGKEMLINRLNHMEFIRLLLMKLQELTGLTDQSICNAIENLETKEQILQKSKSVYDAANTDFKDNVMNGRYLAVKENILNGANINQIVHKGVGAQIIHRFCQDSQRGNRVGSPQMLHSFLMCGQAFESQKSTVNPWYNHNTYWSAGQTPIKLILNGGNFHLAFLWIANGYEINDPDDFYSSYTHGNIWTYIIQWYLVKTFTQEKQKIALREAYRFYRDFENGFVSTLNETIDLDSLLWIICVLGNSEILQLINEFHSKIEVNQVIPRCNFTPLMMAVFCGQEEIVDWLISNGANMYAEFLTNDPEKYGGGRNFALAESAKPHLFHLALSASHYGTKCYRYEIAQKLENYGLIPTEAQKEVLENGLRTLVVAPSQDNKQTAIQPIVSGHAYSALTLVHSTIHGLSETKAWLLEKKATDIRSQHQRAMDELVQQGIQQLSIDQKRYSMALRQVKQLMGNIRPLVEFDVLSIPDFVSKMEDMNEIESDFGDLIESASDFTDKQFIAYEAPVAHTLPVSSEEIPSLETHILEQRCQKERKSLSLQRTTELLTQVVSHFNTLPKAKAPAVLFIGQTGAGKSTAVNRLLGVKYHKIIVKRKNIVHTEQPEYTKTNNGKKSETLFPNVHLSSDSSYYLVDMPGFGDTRGEPERISHGISTQLLSKRFKALKGIVIVCEETDIDASRCQLLRKTLENAGRMICQMPEQASQHVLFAVTKSKKMNVDDIFEELKDLKQELNVSRTEDDTEHYIAIALSALTQSKEQIILLDVADPESVAQMHQKIAMMPKRYAKAFNFSHSSPEFSLLRTAVQSILDDKTELEQGIQQRRDVLANLYKTELEKQLVVLDMPVDTITQECEALLLSSDSIDRSSLERIIELVKSHSELVKKLQLAMTSLSNELGGTEKDQLIGQGQDVRAELLAQYRELQSKQAFFDYMLMIQDILNPDSYAKFSADDNELDGYETDEGAADDLECFAKSIIPANHVLVENADKSEIVSIFKKRGTIPGEYESNPIYMGLVQHTLFKQPLRARYIGKVDEYADGVIVRLPTSQVV